MTTHLIVWRTKVKTLGRAPRRQINLCKYALINLYVEKETVGCVRPLSLFYSDASADGVKRDSSFRALARSAQAERDNESYFF
ncbi:hypothetical protein EVAR_59225_1, partial [Eumeta japonica]